MLLEQFLLGPILYSEQQLPVCREYKILSVLEFNSTRKRMSVIVQTVEGKILLLSKGADRCDLNLLYLLKYLHIFHDILDVLMIYANPSPFFSLPTFSVLFPLLDKHGNNNFEEQTRDHVNEYADAGLRTLILAYREIDEEEFREFNDKFNAARNAVSADREILIEKVAETIERDLILLGATAVEDKLQRGVPECIDKLAQAGIKIWVLTGDKMETAINIGYDSALFSIWGLA